MGAVRALQQKAGLVGVAMLVAVPYVVVATYSAFGGLPYNSIHLPGVTAIAPVRWLPQGWAFFSRDAREQDLYLWRWSDGRWQPASRAPHGEPRNLFGFARASRSQRAEAAALAGSVPDSLWSDCRAADTQCLELEGVGVPPVGRTPAFAMRAHWVCPLEFPVNDSQVPRGGDVPTGRRKSTGKRTSRKRLRHIAPGTAVDANLKVSPGSGYATASVQGIPFRVEHEIRVRDRGGGLPGARQQHIRLCPQGQSTPSLRNREISG